MAEDVILSAKMSSDELLKSIDNTLQKCDAKFSNFVKHTNAQLDSIGKGATINMATNFNSQIDAMTRKIDLLQGKIDTTTKGIASGANISAPNAGTNINLNDLQQAQILSKDIANYWGKAAANAKKLNEQILLNRSSKLTTEEDKVNMLVLKRSLLLAEEQKIRAKIVAETNRATAAEQKNKIALAGKSYGSAMAMESASIQQRIDKIKALQIVQKNLSDTDVNYKAQIVSTNREIQNLQKANKAALTSGIELERHNNRLAESFKNLSRRVFFYAGLGALTGFVRQIYEVRGEYEMLERSMGALLGNFAQGSELFNKIQAQALKSPFTVIDLAGAAKQLIAYNFGINEVADTTSRLADLSSALGAPIERLVYNLGQIKAQTVLTARDARDFANAGFAIVPMLSKLYTEQGKFGDGMVTTADVYDMMSKKMVSYSDVMQVINNATNEGGMFFDFQAKQAETLKGQLSNLTDVWNMMLNQMGEGDDGVLKGTVSVTRELLANWKLLTNSIAALAVAYGAKKATILAMTSVMGQNTLSLKKQLLTEKEAITQQLYRKSILGSLTAEEKAYLATSKQVTVSEMSNLLATKGLSKEQLILKYALSSKNGVVRQAIVQNNLLTASEMAQATAMGTTGVALKVLGLAFRSFGAMVISALPTMAITGFIMLLAKLYTDWQDHNAVLDEINNKYADMQKNLSNISVDVVVAGGDLDKQRAALDELIEMAKTKFNIVFDVDTSKLDGSAIAAKIVEVKNTINNALTTGKVFEVSAENVGLKDYMNDLKNSAFDFYTTLNENKYSLINTIQAHKEAGKATQEELKALEILIALQGKSYSTETLARIKEAYTLLGLIKIPYEETAEYGVIKVVDNLSKVKEAAKGYGIENEKIVSNMLFGWTKYTEQLQKAKEAYGEFVKDVKSNIAFEGLTTEQREMKIKVGIDAAATKIEADEFTKQQMIYWANKDFKTNIVVGTDPKSLDNTEKQLSSWATSLQVWANRNKIKLGVELTESSEEVKVAEQTLQDYTDAIKERDVIKRKIENGNLLQEEYIDFNNRLAKAEENVAKKLEIAKRAGADLSSVTNKSNKEKEKGLSLMANAIKNEISLINDLNSSYDKLTKVGMSSGDAIKFLGKEYSATINAINGVLSKNKMPQFKIADFAGKNSSEILALLRKQRNLIPKNAKSDVYAQFDAIIKKLNVEAETIDYTEITDNIKRDLANIKEKYELGIEIEADPKMSKMFSEMFKIDTSQFPKNAREAINQMQYAINKELGKKGYASFNILSTDLDKYAESKGIDKTSASFKQLADAQKQARDMIQKEFIDTSNILDDYVAKYGDYSTKIQAIEVERLSNLSKLNSYYNTEQLRQTQEYQDRLFAINSMADKKTAEAKLNQFKDSELYVKMFQNLDYLSTSTIVNLKNGLAELQKSLSDLNPEQIKQVVEQQQKLDDELTSRNPFKGLIGNIKEYISLLKNRKKDEEEAIRAQNDYNQQENKVILLRDKLAKDDREKNLSKEQRSNLEGQLAMENQILASKKQQKDVAGEQISKAEKLMQVLGAQLSGAAQQIDFASKAITSVRDDLSSVGVDLGDNLNYAIDGFSKASEGISMAVQSLISGNVAGFIAGMVKATIGQGQIFAGLFGGNKKNEYDKLKKSLDGLIEALNNSIEKQKELISGVSGARAISYYKDAIKDNNALADSYRELAKTRAADGASWGSHSYAYRTNKALKDDWAEMTKLIGKSVKSVDDMFNLTADELELIQTKMPKAWSELDGTIRENLEGVIKTGEAAKELQEALSMSLVGISLDDLVSDFSNMFSSLDTTTQDFADNFEKYMRNAIIRTMVYGEEFQKDISDWYKSFQQAMSDEALSTAEKDMLKTRYDELVGKYQQRVKDLGLSGETTSQLSALQQGISQVSEATASALEAKINSIDAQGYLANTYRQQLISIGNMQLAVQSEILLRMQQGYQVQLAIQNILNGWSNNSGQAVRVQLIPT